ncbi:GEVED domain-containing protein [Polluticaenibacter yanchengensis]|uniref:GEVED domain-containing protein n=1 Tax=Polluticaenibacter yanchengensis TaxID=3014562 RepID=A0ABT4UMW2_9BACT|nr:GEVED domain-containing protein [Chitinophagaceae bacterium LY-5]
MKQVYKTIAYSLSAIILLLLLNTGLLAQPYCEPNSTGSGYTNCTYNGGITKFEFAGISNTTSSCDNSGTVGYTYFSSVTAASAILGSTYTVSVTMYDPSAGSTAAIWIDYDQDGVFSSAEFLLLGTVTTAASTYTFTNSITIPSMATTGTSRIRIRTKRGGTLTATNACGVSGSDRGEIEDYKIDLISNVACTGTPAPGNTLSTASSTCSGTQFTLSLQNAIVGSEISYQWQSSADNTTWNNITGATSKTLLTSQTFTNYYRCQVSCSGNATHSTAVLVNTSSYALPILEAFNSTALPTCWTQAVVGTGTNTIVSTLSSVSPGNSATNGTHYLKYPSGTSNGTSARLSAPAFSTIGKTDLKVSFDMYQDNATGGSLASALNTSTISVQYSLDGTTWTTAGTAIRFYNATGGWFNKEVSLPAAANNQPVLHVSFLLYYSQGPCNIDNIVIRVPEACAGTPNPGSTIAGSTNICSSASFSLSLENNFIATGITYQWEYSADQSSWTNISGATSATLITTQSVERYYRCAVTCSGSTGYSLPVKINLNKLPFFEGFESGYTNGSSINGCWTQQSAGGSQTWVANNSSTSYNRTPRTGSWNAYLQYSNTDWMFYALSFESGKTYELEFYARQDATSGATVSAYYGIANTAASMTNPIINATAVTSGGYQKFSGRFSPAISGTFYVGINGTLNSSPWYVSMDDISIVEIITCTVPTSITTSEIKHNRATASWLVPAAAPSGGYQYYLSTSSTAPTAAATATGTVSNATVLLESLAAETTYYFWVRANCGTTSSAWSSVATFTTTAVPITNVNNIGFNGIDCNSAKISWTKPADFNANAKVLVYLKSGSAIESGLTSLNAGDIYTDIYFQDGDSYDADVNAYAVYYGNGNEVTVNGLQSGQTYYALVYVVENDTKYSSGLSSGANSVAIPASIAKYRTVSNGNFNSLSVWQYNSCGTTWVTATQLPGSANDVEIYHNITLQQNITLHDINLENVGKFDLGNYNLTVTGSINGYSSANYFVTSGSGKLVRSVDAAVSTADVMFPVGNASLYAPVKLVPVQSANSFAVKYGDATTFASTETEWKNIAASSWDITKLNANITQVRVGLSAPTPSLTWHSIVAEGTSVAPVSTDALVIMHFGEDGWEVASDSYTGTLTGGGDHPEYIAYGTNGTTSNGRFIFSQPVSSFSPFTLGVAATSVVLPVNFVYANVKTENNANVLNWEIATNEPVRNFEVEVSVDNGLTFKIVSTITGSQGNTFRFIDNTIYNNASLLYRIKANTIAGKFYYSSILKTLVNNNTIAKITIVPNPVTGSQFKLNASNLKTGIYQLSVISVDGKMAHTKSIKIQESGNTVLPVELSNKLSAGIYILKIENATARYVYKIVSE